MPTVGLDVGQLGLLPPAVNRDEQEPTLDPASSLLGIYQRE